MMKRVEFQRIYSYVLVALLVMGLLFYAEHMFSVQIHIGLFRFWISLGLLLVSENVPIPTAHNKFHFRTVIQFPLIVLLGLFPVLVAEVSILLAQHLLRLVLLRTSQLQTAHIFRAMIPATVAATLLRVAGNAGLQTHIPSLGWIGVALFGYLLTSYLLFRIVPIRTVTHPVKSIPAWYEILLLLDSIMALGFLLEQSLSGAWTEFAISFQFVAILTTVWLYTDSSIRRYRLVYVTQLMTNLAQYTSLEELTPNLFAGLAHILSFEEAAIWVSTQDRHLHPLFVHESHGNSSLFRNAMMESISIPSGVGLEGFSFSSQETVRVNSHNQFTPYDNVETRAHYSSAVAAPIVVQKETYGVLALYHRSGIRTYNRGEAELLSLVSSQLGSALVHLIRYEESRLKAHMDEMTGVYNYRFFDAAVHHEIKKSKASGQPLTLMVLDIDYFKQVNDSYGHLAGNAVLIALSQILREMVRDTDILARYGGEEFTILLPGLSSEESQAVAERIRQRVENARFPIEESILGLATPESTTGKPVTNILRVTVSIGLATYPTGADSAVTLLRHADRAMYVGAKQSGRNKVSIYA